MNTYSSHGRIVEIPLPKSPAAARRCSGEGSSPATIGARRRNQAVDGPPPKWPATNRISSASGANIGRKRWIEVVVAPNLRAGRGGHERRRDPVGELHLQRPRAHDLRAVGGEHRRLRELDAAAGADGLGDDAELTERHRPQELIGDASDRQAVGRRQPLERAHQQRRRRTAVLGPGVPRAAGQFGGDKSSVLAPGIPPLRTWPAHGSARLHSAGMSQENGNARDEATFTVKAGLAEMLKGGVIMDVVTPEQAKIAEDAGAAAVMALERVPADIRRDGGVARMSDPEMIKGIQDAVTIPVMAKARIGHFVEAQVLEALEVDYIDESEVLTPADEANHIDKWAFKVPFVCGATNLGEALRRIGEGAAMIRSKGEAGTGDIVEAVRHLRVIGGEIRRLTMLDEAELATAAKELGAPLHLIRQVAQDGRLPGRDVLRGWDRDPG